MDLQVTSSPARRIEWIDWMKALGIYLIVLGHFYSVGEEFIYVFHVPLFFAISGFLSKKESSQRVFWKKTWYNLAVPMLLMATVNLVFACMRQLADGTFEWQTFYWFVRNVTFGMVAGFDALWFVYTLILLKLIFQYCPSRVVFYVLVPCMLALAYCYNGVDRSGYPFFLKDPNVLANVLTAYPFFALGVAAGGIRKAVNEWRNKRTLVLVFAGSLGAVGLSYYYNQYVAMYACDYGGSLWWFLVGGVAGCLMVFAISKLLGRLPKTVAIIARGTIIILGFHKIMIYYVRELVAASYTDVVFAAVIVLLFVPIIILTEKYLPLMAGKYRIRRGVQAQ